MGLTIEQVLLLAGRLDDAPGFDSARERYRRFLQQHVDTIDLARPLLEQCQHAPGEQQRRALQDLVVLTGRFLGFDVVFGAYERRTDAAEHGGVWRARGRLTVVIEVRSPHLTDHRVDALRRAGAAWQAASGANVVGLCVLTSEATRHKLEEAVAAAPSDFRIGAIPLRALIALADAVVAGSLTHEQVVRMLEASIPGEFILEVLGRLESGQSAQPALPAAPHAARSDAAIAAPNHVPAHNDEPGYWIATVGPDHATRPEEFLELVVGRRNVFGIADGASPATAGPGDRVCFYIAGKGVVGHARVGSKPVASGTLRDAHRFRQLLQVEDVKLHLTAPVPLDPETQLRLRTAGLVTSRQAPTLVRISRESFAALTSSDALPLSG